MTRTTSVLIAVCLASAVLTQRSIASSSISLYYGAGLGSYPYTSTYATWNYVCSLLATLSYVVVAVLLTFNS